MTNESGAPQGNPGDIVNWPMLKIVYRTDPEKIAALLPPGIESGANPHVTLTIYNFPVPDEPELPPVHVELNRTGIPQRNDLPKSRRGHPRIHFQYLT